MSSDGPYSRYTAPSSSSSSSNPYGQSYSGSGAYSAPGYGAPGGQQGAYGSGPPPGGYGSSYSAPQYGMPGSFPGQPEKNELEKGKKGKKSLALQALNQNVFLWAGFFSASLFVYFVLSGGDFSFLMTYGAMSRMFGFGILNFKTFKSQRATGVSKKTLHLYTLVFLFRLSSIVRHEGYLPYDKSGDWLYHVIEIMSLSFTGCALWACSGPFKSTYQADADKFGEYNVPSGYGAIYLAVPVLVISIVFHPNLNSDFFSDVAWTYAMYLESVALLPQLWMFQKQANGVVELLTAHFVAALGFGRIMEFVFWMYSYHELATSAGSKLPGYLALLSQFGQLLLMVDFFWYYFSAVKNATPLVLPSHSTGGNMV
eukprot:CAMPEP_0184858682 /NCGR_PEP_ID=MMETSP0580-20130426/3766_1 /TAXON_ID=1118495 /ORGANISM="Dactyliosolen fragilissimus" /LENGTH=369 /DNA_ID=CAMNT_0027354971 /DNA_START=81 /DNA_END=1190 /DNA_ORIENTATION=-